MGDYPKPIVKVSNKHIFKGSTLFDFWQQIGNRMNEFMQCDPMLQCVFFDAARYAYLHFAKRILITGIKDDYGLHSTTPIRAIDVNVDQTENNTWKDELSQDEAEELCVYLNSRYCYDPSRPQFFVAVFGWRDPDGFHNNHIHLQVFPLITIYLGCIFDEMGLVENV